MLCSVHDVQEGQGELTRRIPRRQERGSVAWHAAGVALRHDSESEQEQELTAPSRSWPEEAPGPSQGPLPLPPPPPNPHPPCPWTAHVASQSNHT